MFPSHDVEPDCSKYYTCHFPCSITLAISHVLIPRVIYIAVVINKKQQTGRMNIRSSSYSTHLKLEVG
jgi:hypothetical protein